MDTGGGNGGSGGSSARRCNGGGASMIWTLSRCSGERRRSRGSLGGLAGGVWPGRLVGLGESADWSHILGRFKLAVGGRRRLWARFRLTADTGPWLMAGPPIGSKDGFVRPWLVPAPGADGSLGSAIACGRSLRQTAR